MPTRAGYVVGRSKPPRDDANAPGPAAAPPRNRQKIPQTFPQTFPRMNQTQMFGETCAVSLSVELPRALAMELEEVQRREPEVLRRILMYGMTRRAIYESLASEAVDR